MSGLIQGYRVVVFGMAFALFSACVDQDEVLRVLRRFSYRSALTAVLATRLVPVLARDAARMSDASRCRPVPAGRLEVARAALSGSLERAVDVAAALEVRGYSRAAAARAGAAAALAPRRARVRRGGADRRRRGGAAHRGRGLGAGVSDAGDAAGRRWSWRRARWSWPAPRCRSRAAARGWGWARVPDVLAYAEGFGYRYAGRDVDALAGVDLELEEGSFTLLAGLSGSGKSTLLRALCGLVPHFHGGHARGRLVVGGMDVREHGPADLAAVCGTVFQDPESQVVMGGVRAEIALALEHRGQEGIAIARAVEEVALTMGIGHLLDRRTDSLSGGELQRVAIAAALVGRPRLLLLDEPDLAAGPGGR